MPGLRTVVTFRSTAFNTTEEKDYFINPGCFGDDVGKWLIQEFRTRGLRTDEEPGAEDFGWYITFQVGDIEYCLVIAYRPPDGEPEGDWIGWLERSKGLFASMLGLRKRGIEREAAQAIHEVLSSSERIREVRWHFQKDFDAGGEELGSETP